jgi:hypothetical protein
MEHEKEPVVYYHDKFCKIDEKGVELYHYYLPIKGSTHIKWSSIEDVHTTEELDLDRIQVRGWGMGLSSIWWAVGLDYRSQILGIVPDHNIVIRCHHDPIGKGFSTENDAHTVVKIIKEHMQGK